MAGSTRSFSSMVNEYLHYDLVKEELEEKSLLWSKIDKDLAAPDNVIVPFQSQQATSVRSGGLTPAADIAEAGYSRGVVTDFPQITGSMKFWERDLVDHKGQVKEKSFLGDFLPAQVDDLTDYMAAVLSHHAFNGDSIADTASAGDTSGNLTVTRVERMKLGQKITVNGVTGYVRQIDINNDEINVKTTKTGSTNCDFTGAASGSAIYLDGFQTKGFGNLRKVLLSAANGGEATYLGVSKLSSTLLQAVNMNGGGGGLAITAANILEKLFDARVRYNRLCKKGAADVVLSYKHLGSIMKVLNDTKSPYQQVPGSTDTKAYGFVEIELFGPKGKMKIVAMDELDDDIIMFIDWKSMKIHSQGGLKRHVDLDGNAFTTVRDDSGNDTFYYLVDWIFRGELVVSKPSNNLIIHSVSY